MRRLTPRDIAATAKTQIQEAEGMETYSATLVSNARLSTRILELCIQDVFGMTAGQLHSLLSAGVHVGGETEEEWKERNFQ